MATSPHVLATRAGFDVLKAGGNAIEAAIAIGATIGVVYPHFCGLGGDAVWLVADRHGDRDCFLGIGQAAAELPKFENAIPVRGPLSMLTSACAVDSWGHAHSYSTRRWRGRMPFSALLADAIRHVLLKDPRRLRRPEPWGSNASYSILTISFRHKGALLRAGEHNLSVAHLAPPWLDRKRVNPVNQYGLSASIPIHENLTFLRYLHVKDAALMEAAIAARESSDQKDAALGVDRDSRRIGNRAAERGTPVRSG